jgi:hypothetical protein
VAGPVNVPARTAVRLAVTKVFPPSVRVLVMVTVRDVKVPLAGELVLAEAGTADKAAAAAAAMHSKRRLRMSVLRSSRAGSLGSFWFLVGRVIVLSARVHGGNLGNRKC